LERFAPMLREGKVYEISGAIVKMVNKRFTSIKNDFCMTLSPKTEINEVFNDNKIQEKGYSFTKLDKIAAEMPQTVTIDVIGLIVNVGPLTEVRIKDGSLKKNIKITISDDTYHQIDVTVWEDLACAPFAKDNIVAFKSTRISMYSGLSLNASSNKVDLILDVEHSEVIKI
jgi:ssDNA-binding replication factor A large subunit